MPHKRAKNSARSSARQQLGSDLPPTNVGLDKDISKRASWVLNAEQVRKDFRQNRDRGEDVGPSGIQNGTGVGKSKKRKRAKEEDEGKSRNILPGETLGHFNKRIEAEFRPSVRAAVKTSSVISRRARDTKSKPASDPPLSTSASTPSTSKPSTSTPTPTNSKDPHSKSAPKSKDRKTEFATLPTRTRLNDIALAPPTLSRAARKLPLSKSKSKGGEGDGEGKGGLSMAQRKAMEEEREVVIRRYREMKAMKETEKGDGGGKGKPPGRGERVG